MRSTFLCVLLVLFMECFAKKELSLGISLYSEWTVGLLISKAGKEDLNAYCKEGFYFEIAANVAVFFSNKCSWPLSTSTTDRSSSPPMRSRWTSAISRKTGSCNCRPSPTAMSRWRKRASFSETTLRGTTQRPSSHSSERQTSRHGNPL